MKAPAFWWGSPGFAAALLQPAASLYGAVAVRRLSAAGQAADAPVICVGNLTVGGSGKTPVALAIADLVRAEGRSPAFLLRGYGGSQRGPVRVEPELHGPEEVGDEALLLCRSAPTVVARNRPDGARLAGSLGCDAIIMDDGLQNPSLRKDLSFAVFDGAVGLGNGRVLPAGPLRAPLGAQWPLVDAAIVVGPGRAGDDVARSAAARGLPVLRARLRPDPSAAARLAGRRVLAFAGIGRPAKFFETLREIGSEVVQAVAFPDHHVYRAGEVARLLTRAERAGLVPVTTEKDAARLAPDPRRAALATLPVTLEFDDLGEMVGLLRRELRR